MEDVGFEPSNSFLDDPILPTWSDLACQPDEKFSEYLQTEFGRDHWIMHSPYLTETHEEKALIASIVQSLGVEDVALSPRDNGALFEYDNKRRTGYIVQSQMGTGKTTFLKHLIEAVIEHERQCKQEFRVLFFTNRVSLATAQMEIMEQLGVRCYKDVDGPNAVPSVMKLIISMESVPRLQDRHHNMEMPMADLIIWDEFTTGALHATSDTIKNKDILLNYIYEVASYGRTTFVYSDAYFCPDGIEIIRNIHSQRDPDTKNPIARDRIFYLMNAFRPARPGLLNFHVEESNFTMAMFAKVDECIGRWEDEIAKSRDEERDPLFNDQLICCFMSKNQLKNYVSILKTKYPSVFSEQYMILIHSDCDAAAVRTTHAATSEWPKALAVFHTSSVLVGTNNNPKERANVVNCRKRSRPVDGQDDEKAILNRIKIDVFCHGISDHPCAISLAQMMARTRYHGPRGMVHFLVPMDHREPDLFPVDKVTLLAQLDETRIYMNDPRLTAVSGAIKSTIVFNEKTGERKVAMALQHNAPYTQFYIYRMLCANRSKVSFLGHLKSILDGYSESVNARRLEDLAPVFYSGDARIVRDIERSNMKSRKENAKKGADVARESYVDVMAKITAKLQVGSTTHTSDVLALYDMSLREIERKRTRNDVLCYDVLKFLVNFGINELPARDDEENYKLLCDLVDEVHPWYAHYHTIYEQALEGTDLVDVRLLEKCRTGQLPDVEASHDKVRLLLLLMTIETVFPTLIENDGTVMRLKIPERLADALSVTDPKTYYMGKRLTFQSVIMRDAKHIPMIQFSHQNNHQFMMIFSKLKNCPTNFSRQRVSVGDRAYSNGAVELFKFACSIIGMELEHGRSSKQTVSYVASLGVDTNAIPVGADGRYSSTKYVATDSAWHISSLYRIKAINDKFVFRRSAERQANAIFMQSVQHLRACKFFPLFVLKTPDTQASSSSRQSSSLLNFAV